LTGFAAAARRANRSGIENESALPRARIGGVGSDIFEIGNEGEIPVKVSRGEFTDDFLVSKR
jgi:hypothetical protein